MSILALRAPLVTLASMLAVGVATSPDLDAGRLQTGVFRYRTLVEGNEAGESRIQVLHHPNSATYAFSNLVTGTFTQSWEAVTTREFAPVSAKLVFGAGPAARPSFELAYSSGRVSGFAFSRTEPVTKRPIDQMVPADTVDQRIDWAAVMAIADVTRGRAFNFHVYDPATQNSPVSAQVEGTKTTRVPAGTYQTVRVVYRIEKAGKSETYVVLATPKPPRFMVKEIFPTGAITELVGIVP